MPATTGPATTMPATNISTRPRLRPNASNHSSQFSSAPIMIPDDDTSESDVQASLPGQHNFGGGNTVGNVKGAQNNAAHTNPYTNGYTLGPNTGRSRRDLINNAAANRHTNNLRNNTPHPQLHSTPDANGFRHGRQQPPVASPQATGEVSKRKRHHAYDLSEHAVPAAKRQRGIYYPRYQILTQSAREPLLLRRDLQFDPPLAIDTNLPIKVNKKPGEESVPPAPKKADYARTITQDCHSLRYSQNPPPETPVYKAAYENWVQDRALANFQANQGEQYEQENVDGGKSLFGRSYIGRRH